MTNKELQTLLKMDPEEMNNTELQKVQMACVQLVLKLDGEKMDVKVMSFGEESLPPQQREIIERTMKILYDFFSIAVEMERKEQA
jgi:hypothetical protein